MISAKQLQTGNGVYFIVVQVEVFQSIIKTGS